jgi:Arc/MetJ-type ribon-helix-helix transcriptional regulator
MRATFSIDEETDAALRRVSLALGTSKSDVVRRAIRELEARCDRLTEQERREKLVILSRLRSEPASRSEKAVEGELQEIREARRAGWRDS